MTRSALSIPGILAALALIALVAGCRKEKPGARSARGMQENTLTAEEEEANQRKADIQFVQLQEKDFLSRLEAAKAGVAKQGNKTRKRLKPSLASLDAKAVRLDSLVRGLPSLPGPGLRPSIAAINAALDSANAELAQMKKSLK